MRLAFYTKSEACSLFSTFPNTGGPSSPGTGVNLSPGAVFLRALGDVNRGILRLVWAIDFLLRFSVTGVMVLQAIRILKESNTVVKLVK